MKGEAQDFPIVLVGNKKDLQDERLGRNGLYNFLEK